MSVFSFVPVSVVIVIFYGIGLLASLFVWLKDYMWEWSQRIQQAELIPAFRVILSYSFISVHEPQSLTSKRDTGFALELTREKGSHELTPGEQFWALFWGNTRGTSSWAYSGRRAEWDSAKRRNSWTDWPQAGGPGTDNVLDSHLQRMERIPPVPVIFRPPGWKNALGSSTRHLGLRDGMQIFVKKRHFWM